MKKNKLILFAFSVLICLQACDKNGDGNNIAQGYEYFPMEVGHWIIYDFEHIILDDGFENDTLKGEMKVVWDEAFMDSADRPAMRLAGYFRTNTQKDWESIVPEMWYCVKTENEVEVIKDNLRTINLKFPLLKGESWEGNVYINTDAPEYQIYRDWVYRITEANLMTSINGVTFDTTITVLQQDYENLIQRYYVKEKYALGVGMISKDFWLLELNTTEPPATIEADWPERANSGTKITYRIKDFGQ